MNHRIEHLGGQFVRQTGSHRRFKANSGTTTRFTTFPQHHGDMPIKTLRSIEADLEPVFGKGWLL